ncbi:MAG: ABC transporter permease [Actinomycetota bacterium]|nr:ABC transporter permease [Actinomycetota bacterium]
MGTSRYRPGRLAPLWLPGLVIGLVFLAAAAAPWLSPHDPIAVDFQDRFAGPSFEHPLGTDQLGRDVLSRLLYGARLSLVMAVSATVGITTLGFLLGLVAGLYGRVVSSVIMRLVDILQALPTLILALVVIGLLGQGILNLVLAIVAIGWATYARVVRGMVLSIREEAYVEAARALGASRLRVLRRHVAPNLVGPVVVLSTLDMGRMLLAVSALSFLGLGVGPPTPEWGAMLAEARVYLDRAPQLLIYPGVAITFLVLAFNLGGDRLRDVLDPRPTRRLLPDRSLLFRRRTRRP